MKGLVKAILKKMLKPFVSRYRLILDRLNEVSYKQDEVLNKLDVALPARLGELDVALSARLGELKEALSARLGKLEKSTASVLSVQSIHNPVTTCPPAHGTLRKIQLAKANVLFAFDRLCKENNLQYWIFWGTLLGAARHGGFIPWDDDIDVCMMRDDYDRLIQVAKSMPQNGKIKWWHDAILRINFSEYDDFYTSVAVDVVPLYQYYKKTTTDEGNRLRRLFDTSVDLSNWPAKPVPLLDFGAAPEAKAIQIMMEGKKPAEEGDIFDVFTPLRGIYRHEWMFPLKTMLFEGQELPVPNNTNKILECDYGDYMMYPPNMYDWHRPISADLKNNWRRYEKLDGFLSLDANDIYDLMTGRKK